MPVHYKDPAFSVNGSLESGWDNLTQCIREAALADAKYERFEKFAVQRKAALTKRHVVLDSFKRHLSLGQGEFALA